jgi:hypothetical protein
MLTGERMSERAEKFHVEEYKALRKEISERIAEIGKIAQYGLSGVAAIYAWLAKETDPAQHKFLILGLFGAVLLSVGTTIRIGFLEDKVIKLGNYVAETIERQFEVEGWESKRRGGRTLRAWSTTLAGFVLLSAVTFVVLIYLWKS